MADLNQETEELKESLAKVSEELRLFGRSSRESGDELMAGGKTNLSRINIAGTQLTKAFNELKQAAGSAASAMYEGKKGAAALNDSLGGVSDAFQSLLTILALFTGPVGWAFIGATKLATAGLTKYTQAANEMADKLYKGYSELAKAGGSASDGMQGLFDDAKKLGLSMDELGSFISVVNANSKDLAMFSGTVADGRKQIAGIGGALETNREEFLRLGMSMADVTDGIGGYIKMQTAMGRVQKGTIEEQAAAAREYILEQDKLTRITGMQRKELEEKQAAALTEEQFGGYMLELEQRMAKGDKDAEAEHKRAMTLMTMAEKVGPEYAKGIRGAIVGNLTDPATRKLIRSGAGDIFETTQAVVKGNMSASQQMDQTVKDVTQFSRDYGTSIAQLGANNKNFLSVAEQRRAHEISNMGFEAAAQKAQEEQDKAAKGQGDKLVNQQAEIIKKQIDANKAMESFVNAGISPAQKAMTKLTDATKGAADTVNRVFGIGKPAAPPEAPKEAKATPGAIAEDKAKEIQAEKDEQKKYLEEKQATAEANKRARDARRQARVEAAATPAPAAPAPPAPAAEAPTAPRAAPESRGGYRRRAAPAAPAAAAPAPAPAAPAPAPAAAAPTVPAAPAAPAAAAPPAAGGELTKEPNTAPPPATAKKAATLKGNAAMSDDDIKKMITKHEGIRDKPYKDSLGLWTVGVGHLIGDGKSLPPEWNRTFTHDEVMAMFDKDYQEHKAAAAAKTPNFNAMTGVGQGAFTDLTFNMGPNWLSKWPNTKKALEEQNSDAVAKGLQNSRWYTQVKGRGQTIVDMVKNAFPQAAEGGTFSGPNSGYPMTLHGPEAVIPLKNDTVPVQITMDSTVGQSMVGLESIMKELLASNRETLSILHEISRSNRQTADSSAKMVRVASS
jgi:GH24 family phage-related lysozyme (muramidase)